MTLVDYRTTSLHFNKGPLIDKKLPRNYEKSENLPCYMQRVDNRIAMNEKNKYVSLKLNNEQEHGFVTP
jgi:hypothetical protein